MKHSILVSAASAVVGFVLFNSLASAPLAAADPAVDAGALAADVTIYRDAYGVPHIDGPTDESVVFGFAYAQAEDYFWQVEDTYILALGRYAEAHGAKGLNSDLLNRAFEVVPTLREDFDKLEPELQSLCAAFVAGLNWYLEKNPDVKPRLISHFEPWHMLSYGRHLMLEMTYRYTRLTDSVMPRTNPEIWAAAGSNGWAIGAKKTRSGKAMLLANPHQPWFGFGQFYEGHLRSGEGWNFTGAAFFGTPLPSLGHNEHLGWCYTTNEPDIADVWRETFDDPAKPLQYRYDGGYRTAVEWTETIKVKTRSSVKERRYIFKKTHHGPVVAKEDDEHYLTARIAGLYEVVMLRQLRRLIRATSLTEFDEGLAMRNFPIMNLVYADKDGNILYQYNGVIPRRDPGFDWTSPVDGSDPRTEWDGYHPISDLPRVLNPPASYVQNCNSSPFTTTDADNPRRKDYPAYMMEDADLDRRRAKISRQLLSEMSDVTFDELQSAAFDTTMYWAQHELPKLADELKQLKKTNASLAAQAAPLMAHLLDWDFRCHADSTQATLCAAWYLELHGSAYPGETLKPQYKKDSAAKFRALLAVAAGLKSTHGDWRAPWGDVFRLQRHANVADLADVPFDDKLPSLPSLAVPGQLGVVFTTYYTPSINVPFVKSVKRRYGVVGTTYLGAYEFGDRIQGATLLNFGVSGDPKSPHYFDQAKLMSEQRLKPELFYWEDVLAGARKTYHPGDE